jgi:hypothetical protein
VGESGKAVWVGAEAHSVLATSLEHFIGRAICSGVTGDGVLGGAREQEQEQWPAQRVHLSCPKALTRRQGWRWRGEGCSPRPLRGCWAVERAGFSRFCPAARTRPKKRGCAIRLRFSFFSFPGSLFSRFQVLCLSRRAFHGRGSPSGPWGVGDHPATPAPTGVWYRCGVWGEGPSNSNERPSGVRGSAPHAQAAAFWTPKGFCQNATPPVATRTVHTRRYSHAFTYAFTVPVGPVRFLPTPCRYHATPPPRRGKYGTAVSQGEVARPVGTPFSEPGPTRRGHWGGARGAPSRRRATPHAQGSGGAGALSRARVSRRSVDVLLQYTEHSALQHVRPGVYARSTQMYPHLVTVLPSNRNGLPQPCMRPSRTQRSHSRCGACMFSQRSRRTPLTSGRSWA